MDRIASLTSGAKEKRLSIGVDTEDSVEDYDDDMDEDEGGWSDDEEGEGAPEAGSDGTPGHGGSGSAKRRKSTRPGSVRASPLAGANRVARTEDEAVQLLLAASSGQTTIDLDPSIDKEVVRRRVEEERERLRHEAEGVVSEATTSNVADSSSSASSASAQSSGAAGVNYQETDLFKKLQAMRASAETAANDTGAAGTAGVVSPRSTVDKPSSALPALKISAEVDPAVAPVRRKESTISPRDAKADKKDKKKKDKADKKDKDKADKKDKAVKSPREKKGVLASLLGK